MTSADTADLQQPPAFATAIGNTPLVRLTRVGGAAGVELWVKLEGCNPGGSAKDRSAWALLSAALEAGTLTPGGTIIESSSGNLGMALARLAAPLGLHFVCVADQNASPVALDVIRAVGGEVRMTEGPDPETGDLLTARKKLVAALLAQQPDAITLDQYANPAPLSAHAEGTMAEIAAGLPRIDEVHVATSTTGTIGGVLRWVREHSDGSATPRVVAVDPVGSILFGGERAARALNGYGAGSLPPLADLSEPDAVERVAELDAVVAARHLARTEGILAGASGGGVIASMLRRAAHLEPGAVVVGVLHDFGWAYLSTVYDDAWVCEKLGVDPADLAAALAAGPTGASRADR